MKLNKKRKDARLPNWLIEVLGTLQIKYQWTFTEALIRTAEKGSVYYNKQWEKMHRKGFPGEAATKEAGIDERCPNDHQENDKSKHQEKEIPNVLIDILLCFWYYINNEELREKFEREINKPFEKGEINEKEAKRKCDDFIKEHHLEAYIKDLEKDRERSRELTKKAG